MTGLMLEPSLKGRRCSERWLMTLFLVGFPRSTWEITYICILVRYQVPVPVQYNSTVVWLYCCVVLSILLYPLPYQIPVTVDVVPGLHKIDW